MSFIQLIEVHTDDLEELQRLHDRWRAATEGQRTVTQEWICRDRDRPDTYVVIVEFPSTDAAAVNNDLPATAEIASAMAALSTEPLTFRNLDLVRHE